MIQIKKYIAILLVAAIIQIQANSNYELAPANLCQQIVRIWSTPDKVKTEVASHAPDYLDKVAKLSTSSLSDKNEKFAHIKIDYQAFFIAHLYKSYTGSIDFLITLMDAGKQKDKTIISILWNAQKLVDDFLNLSHEDQIIILCKLFKKSWDNGYTTHAYYDFLNKETSVIFGEIADLSQLLLDIGCIFEEDCCSK